jgi:outer membrane assembly lipoprotein YfiO
MKLFSSLALALLYIGCSVPSPEETYKKAEEALKAGNIPLAIECYNQVVSDHPGSPLAEQAAFRIAAAQHNEMHDYQGAIGSYQRYVELYPDGEKAPTALFLTGFLYNNELHKLDSAAVAYRLFLERYPKHEMAASAQFELENLGKSPEELLPKPSVAEESAPASSKKSPVKGGRK